MPTCKHTDTGIFENGLHELLKAYDCRTVTWTLTLLEHGVNVLVLGQQGLLQVVQDAKLVKVLLGHVGVCASTQHTRRSAQACQHLFYRANPLENDFAG
jgi:hypothetical protein